MTKMRPRRFLVASLALLTCGVGICVSLELPGDAIKCRTLTGIVGGVFLMLGMVLLDIYRLKPSDKHTAGSLFEQYVTSKIVIAVGKYVRWKCIRSCKNCEARQATVLRSILNQNKDTVAAKDYGLKVVRTVEDFRKQIPLTRYSHYEKYVDMITEHGETNVMFPYGVDFVALTSGTSNGKSKGYPKSTKIRNTNIMPWLLLVLYEMQTLPGCGYLKRSFHIQPIVKPKVTNSGIEQGPVSYFMSGGRVPSYNVVPPLPSNNEDTCMYVYALFALLEEDMASMLMLTTTTCLAMFKALELHWERLCEDAGRGELSSSLDIDRDLRQMVNTRLHGNPTRAQFLRSEFRKGFKNIARRIWPQCSCIFAIRTGSFKTQARILHEKYIGDLPIVTLFHGGTESMYGLNLDLLDEHIRYTLAVDIGLFEFIPEADMDSTSPATLLAHQVEVGVCYEIVVTTLDGLYRYRTEDVIQITGYRDTVPVYKFIRRSGDILSVNLDKVPEVLLYEAVTSAARGWSSTHIVDFTSTENVNVEGITGDVTGTGFYIVFIEMAERTMITTEEKHKVDEELRSRHEEYAAMRANEKLKSVAVEQVTPGTFDKVKALILGTNSDAFFMQYKLPRIVRREDVLTLLLRHRCDVNI